jgi:hypothetical protein
MKTYLTLLVAIATTTLALAQTHLAITANGHPAGFATVSQHIQADGIKIVELRIELRSGTRVVKLNSEARYDAKGMPLRKFQETVATDQGIHKQIIATFDKGGANVVILDGDKRSVKNASLAATAPRASLSEFWFIRDTPKVGVVEKTYQFNTDSLTWDLVETEYKGKKTLKIEDRSVSVNEVVSRRGDKETTSYLDDLGLPVLVDQGDFKMVKIWPK